jgi:Lambda phage tail tube protein, TTP
MYLALFVALVLHPAVLVALVAIAASVKVKTVLVWLAAAASYAIFGTTVAFPGYGSHLASGGLAGSSYTNIAQLKKINFSGLKAEFDDITNLDSPTIFKEWMKTVVDGDTVQFDGVMNPADPTTELLLTLIGTAGTASLYFWKITLTDGSILVFQGYVQDFKFGAEYNKAITFSGAIKIVGNITPTWS